MATTRGFVLSAATIATLTLGLMSPAPASPPAEKSGPMYVLPSRGSIAGSSVEVLQQESGARIVVHTSGLQAGHAYTLWVMTFNFPEFCTHPGLPGTRCSGLDLPHRGGDSRVNASVDYGTGHIVESESTSFAAFRRTGDSDTGGYPGFSGPGLINPMGAEIHVVVRDHGVAAPPYVDDQIRTFNGGCNAGEPNEGQCVDVQAGAAV